MTAIQQESGDGMARRPATWAPSHDVHFYDDEAVLVEAVSTFLYEGARQGQPIVMIATPSHRAAFIARMRSLGVDLDDLTESRDYVILDARETLSAFMEGSRPNPELFHATVGNVFEKLMRKRRYLLVRAYGEMVDLLWQDGKAEAALALEDLWNELAERFQFTLLCAYAEATVRTSSTARESIISICSRHRRTLPLNPQIATRLGLSA